MLVAWTAERIVGLAPESGKLLWEYPWLSGGPNVDPCVSPVKNGNQLFFTSVPDLVPLLKPMKQCIAGVFRTVIPQHLGGIPH